MFMTNNNSKQQQEILLMINHIVRELIVEFGKDENEAMELVKNSQVEKSLAENPIGFHESAYDWAISVLADNNDIETLERHLHH